MRAFSRRFSLPCRSPKRFPKASSVSMKGLRPRAVGKTATPCAELLQAPFSCLRRMKNRMFSCRCNKGLTFMTIKLQQPNMFDKILGFFGKKRGFVLPEDNPYQKWGPYVTYVIPRENFIKALLRLNKHNADNILHDIKDIEGRLNAINKEELHKK